MAILDKREVTVLLKEEHLRKMIDDYLLKENEIGDRVRRDNVFRHLLSTKPRGKERGTSFP
jgi:hypothetical protein